MLARSYERTRALLSERATEHHLVAEALLEHETLTGDELRRLVAGKKVTQPPS
jgi:cell division protease FtsH